MLLVGVLLIPYAMYLTEAAYRLPAVWHAALFALLSGAITAACDGLSASSRGNRMRGSSTAGPSAYTPRGMQCCV